MPIDNSRSALKRRITMMYFSPTGTTEKILEKIAMGMGIDNPLKMNLTRSSARKDVKHLIGKAEKTTDYWLIGSPVHSGRIPRLMEKELVPLDGHGKPTVAVVVYGNRDFGIALRQLVETLTSRNFWVVGAAAFIAEHSFSHMFPIAVGRPDSKDRKQPAYSGKAL